jgi:hypothetical protein
MCDNRLYRNTRDDFGVLMIQHMFVQMIAWVIIICLLSLVVRIVWWIFLFIKNCLVLIGAVVALPCLIVAMPFLWLWDRWKKGRSEQRWEPIQTEVYGDQHVETLEMSVEEAARFAAYVAHSGGNVTVNVVDAPPMKDVTPRVPRWLLK